MANGRAGRRRDSNRIGGSFAALPWRVMDSPAYASLGHPAKALLLEFIRQYSGHNNGRLLASSAHLQPRGWRSADVITRAKRELLEAGFIHETVKGHRPNHASWYALTWRALDIHPGFDPSGAASFIAYAFERSGAPRNAGLIPPHGARGIGIAPPDGVGRHAPTPRAGAIKSPSPPAPTPPHGNHLDTPSARELATADEGMTT